jgi:hypothetical protein
VYSRGTFPKEKSSGSWVSEMQPHLTSTSHMPYNCFCLTVSSLGAVRPDRLYGHIIHVYIKAHHKSTDTSPMHFQLHHHSIMLVQVCQITPHSHHLSIYLSDSGATPLRSLPPLLSPYLTSCISHSWKVSSFNLPALPHPPVALHPYVVGRTTCSSRERQKGEGRQSNLYAKLR